MRLLRGGFLLFLCLLVGTRAARADAPAAPPPPPAAVGEPAASVAPAAPAAEGLPRMSPDEWWARALGTWRTPIVVPPCAPPCWSGDITVRYRGRYSSDESDNDLYQYFRARYRREDAPGISGSMLFRLSEDLDGLADGSSFFVFDSVDDTYDSPVLGRLYHLYGNYRPASGPLEQVRVGRQYVTAGDVFQMDGAHVTFQPQGPCCSTRIYAFGGLPTHLYESSIQGDWMVGAGAAFEPWCGASLEVADIYFEDQNGVYGTPTSNLLSAEATQRWRDCLTLRARYQHLNDHPRIASGSFDLLVPQWDFTLRGSLYSQLRIEQQQVYDLDPYYAILQQLAPYYDVSLSASKGIGRWLTAEVGAHARQLWTPEDEGTFNREYWMFYGTLSTCQWPRRNLALAVTGEWWTSPPAEDVGAMGFEAQWTPSCKWRWTAGVDYSLYRTDLYAAAERYDNYGYFVRARWRPTTRWEWDGSVRLDSDDFDDYVTLNLLLRWDF